MLIIEESLPSNHNRRIILQSGEDPAREASGAAALAGKPQKQNETALL